MLDRRRSVRVISFASRKNTSPGRWNHAPFPPGIEEVARRVLPEVVGLVCLLFAVCPSGCALQEVRGKTAFGPEFLHSGTNSTNEVRYDARQGLELRWNNGVTTGVTYRRRDVDEGSGNNDNLVLFEFGYPIWKASKSEDKLPERVEELEKRLRELEAGQTAPSP